MKTKNPSACSSRIEPYIASVRRRSTGLMPWKDCRIILRMFTPVRGVTLCVAIASTPRSPAQQVPRLIARPSNCTLVASTSSLQSDGEEAGMELELHWRSEDGLRLPMALWRPGPGYQMISSGIVGGGLGPREWVLNAQVAGGYDRTDPVVHLADLAAGLGLSGPGVGL